MACVVCNVLTCVSFQDTNTYDYYWRNMRQFGEVLTDMERRGIRVDAKDYLASVEEQARKDRDEHSKKFRQWAADQIGAEGLALNPASATQLATFLFGGTQMGHTYRNSKSIGGKFDFTTQISENHEIKTGFSFRNDNLVERNLQVLYDQNYNEPTVLLENKS